jgi:flavin reductase (DIM6/NTAB) family NADH-FMN oxidoreductase RutF
LDDRQLSVERYRGLFGAVPSAVAVVATTTGSGPHGTTVSAFGPLSLQPPLVQVCLDLDSHLLAQIGESGRFLINILARGQEQLARRFAKSGPDDFGDLDWQPVHGLPRLADCHGWLAAKVERTVEAGDHAIVIGLAIDSGISPGVPLLYHDRTFHVLASAGA